MHHIIDTIATILFFIIVVVHLLFFLLLFFSIFSFFHLSIFIFFNSYHFLFFCFFHVASTQVSVDPGPPDSSPQMALECGGSSAYNCILQAYRFRREFNKGGTATRV